MVLVVVWFGLRYRINVKCCLECATIMLRLGYLF